MGKIPLIIARDPNSGKTEVQTHGDPFRVSGGHCIILRRVDQIILEAFEMPQLTVNGKPVSDNAILMPGDVIRPGTGDDTALKIITCL